MKANVSLIASNLSKAREQAEAAFKDFYGEEPFEIVEESAEADHDVPLWDGGEHSAANIVRRCVPCHRAKTADEAARRAARRRQERGLPEQLPEHHPGQGLLVAA